MFGLFSKNKNGFQNLNSAAFEEGMKEKDAIILDVRSPSEYAAGHIPKAKNVNVMDRSFVTKIAKLDPEKTYYVYCKSGMRSRSACKAMTRNGFEKVNNLSGGIMSWGGKVVR